MLDSGALLRDTITVILLPVDQNSVKIMTEYFHLYTKCYYIIASSRRSVSLDAARKTARSTARGGERTPMSSFCPLIIDHLQGSVT